MKLWLLKVFVFFAEFVYSRYYFNFKNYLRLNILVRSEFRFILQLCLKFYATDTHKSDEML